MSWRVANTCAERKFGSATRKQIIMFLEDKASDDGSGIWCSKGTIQRHTELGETTVKRTVREFLKEGILVETGARTCKNGFTVVYRIDLAKAEALEPTAEPEIETGATTPIINHPEVAILGINKMAVRPLWDGQQFVPRKMMNISASFDHRVIDGWDAASFVALTKRFLENPAMIFMEAEA